MSTLLAATALTSCISFGQWVGYYHHMMYKSNTPTSWMIDGNPAMMTTIKYTMTLRPDMTRATAELCGTSYCRYHPKRAPEEFACEKS